MNELIDAQTLSDEDDREYIGGLQRDLLVLELFGKNVPRLTPMKASELTGIPRAAARRCLRTLEKAGFLVSEGGSYSLTSRVLRLGHAYFDTSQLAKIGQTVLETLSERTGESASLAILDGADAVFIARASSGASFTRAIGVGVRVSAYNTATGRVLLAGLPQQRVDELFIESPPRRLTSRSISDRAQIEAAIQAVREHGYAFSDQEAQLGSRSIAVPVFDEAGATIASMSIAVFASQSTSEEIIEKLLPALEGARDSLMAAL